MGEEFELVELRKMENVAARQRYTDTRRNLLNPEAINQSLIDQGAATFKKNKTFHRFKKPKSKGKMRKRPFMPSIPEETTKGAAAPQPDIPKLPTVKSSKLVHDPLAEITGGKGFEGRPPKSTSGPPTAGAPIRPRGASLDDYLITQKDPSFSKTENIKQELIKVRGNIPLPGEEDNPFQPEPHTIPPSTQDHPLNVIKRDPLKFEGPQEEDNPANIPHQIDEEDVPRRLKRYRQESEEWMSENKKKPQSSSIILSEPRELTPEEQATRERLKKRVKISDDPMEDREVRRLAIAKSDSDVTFFDPQQPPMMMTEIEHNNKLPNRDEGFGGRSNVMKPGNKVFNFISQNKKMLLGVGIAGGVGLAAMSALSNVSNTVDQGNKKMLDSLKVKPIDFAMGPDGFPTITNINI